jgi:hypothetical protein
VAAFLIFSLCGKVGFDVDNEATLPKIILTSQLGLQAGKS